MRTLKIHSQMNKLFIYRKKKEYLFSLKMLNSGKQQPFQHSKT